jgi:hypothetical protein
VSTGPAAVPYGHDQTVVAEPLWGWVVAFTGLPLLGAGAGWLLVELADRVAQVPFAPLRFLFEWLEDAPRPATTVIACIAGAVAGLVLAVVGWEERLTVAVSREGVTLRRGRSSRTVPARDVTGAFRDGKQLVLQTRDGAESARETSDLTADALRAAFEAHGYRWYPAGDPHAAEFARWVEGIPGVPPAAEALLRARQKAVEKKDKAELAALREELARHDVVVREEGGRQFWRLTKPTQ